jgi:hypothetical protein
VVSTEYRTLREKLSHILICLCCGILLVNHEKYRTLRENLSLIKDVVSVVTLCCVTESIGL